MKTILCLCAMLTLCGCVFNPRVQSMAGNTHHQGIWVSTRVATLDAPKANSPRL